jgi:putative transposase
LHYYRRLHKDLYNACVYHRKTEYQKFGRNVTYYDQQNALPAFKNEWVEYKELGSQALQATVKRVDFAFQRFFSGLGKYPKFKSSKLYRGWTYPATSGWKAHTTGDNGALELTGIGNQIQMRGLARTWGTPTTCTIVWKQNKWYASITVNCEPVRKTSTGAIGLDIGTLTAVAFSDGTKIENPRFLANAQKQINKVSKQLRRKRKPEKRKAKASRRWKKVRKKVSKLQNKVGLRRQNWVHQIATQIVSNNSLVATEELTVKNMTRKTKKRVRNSEVSSRRTALEGGKRFPPRASSMGGSNSAPTPPECKTHSRQGSKRKRQKTGLNRSILDVGFGMLRQAIKYKVIEAGGVFVDVPTRKVKPSQTCPQCNRQQQKTLDERIHQCACGCTLDRDVASALVCLNYARGLGTNLLDGDGSALPKSLRSCGGFRQQNQMKRQKPTVAPSTGGSS